MNITTIEYWMSCLDRAIVVILAEKDEDKAYKVLNEAYYDWLDEECETSCEEYICKRLSDSGIEYALERTESYNNDNVDTKLYKQFSKEYIGGSDIANLIMVGCGEDGLMTMPLQFGGDGAYNAYIVDKTAEIGSHYKKVATFESWLKIYDDEGLTASYDGKEINVYRSGNFGCVIQVIE